ncbi:MAG: hypothetical protein VKL39_15940 [Leptolyngbyaceae bacterium]|nr:hypothetical protein [Leptolyngbyaceae bacterium]
MMRTLKVSLMGLVVISSLGVLGFQHWKKGSPFQEPIWSPNGEYYLQRYDNLTLDRLIPAFPGGGGSDRVNGYVRLFKKDGTLVQESFVYFNREIQWAWLDDEVHIWPPGFGSQPESIIWKVSNSTE